MKNNEKFLNDLENIPDRFLNETEDDNETEVLLKKPHISVFAAAGIAAVIAVPVIIFNLKPNFQDFKISKEKAETTTQYTAQETSASDTEAVTTAATSAVTKNITAQTSIVTVTAPAVTEPVTEANNTEAQLPEPVPDTAPAPAETVSPYVTANADDFEREIAEAILLKDEKIVNESPFIIYTDFIDNEYHGSVEYKNKLEYLMIRAEELPNRYLGSIADEQDLRNKARNFYIDRLGLESVELKESEYYTIGGITYHIKRDYPPYIVEYNKQYDSWYIQITTNKGIVDSIVSGDTEGKTLIVAVGASGKGGPFLVIRGSDGKILAYNG